ncbi:uncharacterized protein LOC125379164 isoform X1 [Haliotis rufescens]|uniref:uncharacterized protein LOC125379164 isoform X1 n=1 Tax=Haliotis rufescens TaxID=6454 RepID=UPI00201F2048|nr:uncharacterized protein LOC125379164 isoform X1 [Haliotis rufescens]
MEGEVVLSDGIRKRLNYFLMPTIQMEASHESSQSHVGTVLSPANFPPYYPEQTTQPPAQNGAPCFYLGDRPNFERDPLQIFPRTDPEDQQIPFAVLEYAPEFGRQRLLYAPLTPPLTPQTPQQARGYVPPVYRDTSHTEAHREPTHRDSWLLFDHRPAATRPLYVQTQPWLPSDPSPNVVSRQQMLEIPIPGSMTPESRQVMLERVTTVVAEHTDEQREEFPLQDPPKSKYKRPLSEDSSVPNVSMTTRYDNPPQSPRHAYPAPKTPQPESAHKSFNFTMDEDRGQMSPKRVKADNGVARPPMSPLVHSDVQQARPYPPRHNDQPPIFQFPDVSETREACSRLCSSDDRQMYLQRVPRCNDERLLDHSQWYPGDQRLSDRQHYQPTRDVYGERPPVPAMVPREFTKNPFQRYVPGQCSPEKYSWRPSTYVRSDMPVGQIQQFQRGSEVRQMTNSSLKRTPTMRSQSNIEYSPSKGELEQMEKEKYSRSISKPEGPVGMQHLQRQYATKDNGYCGYIGEASYPAERPVEVPWQSVYQDARRQGACRQLFGTSEPCYGRGQTYRSDPYTSHISQRGQLVSSNDDYDIYIVPHEPRTEAVTSRPPTSEADNELVYVQPRRQSISCPRDTCRTVSMVQGRSSPEKKHQKGQQIDIKIKCQDVAHNIQGLSEKLQMKKATSPCFCENVEAKIKIIAQTAYSKIRRDDTSRESHERFDREIKKTNTMLKNALETAKAMRDLCGRHRTVTDIYTGSVVIAMQCTTLASLETLREQYKTGELKQLLGQCFVTERLKREFGKYILLSVTISDNDFERCRRNLEEPLHDVRSQRRKPRTTAMLSPSKRITKSADDLENIPSLTPTPVNHCRSASTPVLMTSSPLSSPTHLARSPSTPTKRDRVFSFTGKCPTPTRHRNLSLSSAGELSPRRIFQQINTDDPPCSPSKKNFTFIDQQSSPKLRKSLEDITSDFGNVSVHR